MTMLDLFHFEGEGARVRVSCLWNCLDVNFLHHRVRLSMRIVYVKLEPLREKECENNIGLHYLLGDPGAVTLFRFRDVAHHGISSGLKINSTDSEMSCNPHHSDPLSDFKTG
jgi:hypothetical protein